MANVPCTIQAGNTRRRPQLRFFTACAISTGITVPNQPMHRLSANRQLRLDRIRMGPKAGSIMVGFAEPDGFIDRFAMAMLALR
ncbi:MAG: hypothetical protein CBD89_02595 [Cyanobacteria bacterium TMED229]|nr:MAG: hypothetical protein CBD89_02595 [Cyanobacteria bacterium TMED229]